MSEIIFIVGPSDNPIIIVLFNTNNYHTDLSSVADGDICTITAVHYMYFYSIHTCNTLVFMA